MEKELKNEIIAKYALHEGDTGSPEVQIALLTQRINHLTEPLKTSVSDGRHTANVASAAPRMPHHALPACAPTV